MDDSFASFGLDSLTLLEVVLDLQDAFDIRLTDEDVRELVTPREVYALVVRKLDASRRDELPPASPAPAP
jgi:acyl carrier protein